jgi:hypothetical protein
MHVNDWCKTALGEQDMHVVNIPNNITILLDIKF